nr:16S rRNA (guanine(527)-N(7))-methyltransferase RsmG [Psychrobacter sp. I-STPA10]
MLSHALSDIGLELTTLQCQTLLLYLDKLLLWNKAYNLTAITVPKEALIKHLFDCLAIVPYLAKGTLLDIGTGAGLPGVVVAICQPDRQCTVLDSNQKKIRFIKQISSELSLDNVIPIASRIENFSGQFDVVTSRAFASLPDFVTAAAPKSHTNGVLQAMKGHVPDATELDTLVDNWNIDIQVLNVPRLDETRHLIDLRLK